MIVVESVLILAGENVLPEDQKVIANWVEFDDVTGDQVRVGIQEIWLQPKSFTDDHWNSKPADVKNQDIKNWKNMEAATVALTNSLFDKIVKVVEDAITDGDI